MQINQVLPESSFHKKNIKIINLDRDQILGATELFKSKFRENNAEVIAANTKLYFLSVEVSLG